MQTIKRGLISKKWKYIARDKDGKLWLFSVYPYKDEYNDIWRIKPIYSFGILGTILWVCSSQKRVKDRKRFKDVKWLDEYPAEIEG